MWIICQADNSHEMSRLIFCEKKKEYCLPQTLLGTLRDHYLFVTKNYKFIHVLFDLQFA